MTRPRPPLGGQPGETRIFCFQETTNKSKKEKSPDSPCWDRQFDKAVQGWLLFIPAPCRGLAHRGLCPPVGRSSNYVWVAQRGEAPLSVVATDGRYPYEVVATPPRLTSIKKNNRNNNNNNNNLNKQSYKYLSSLESRFTITLINNNRDAAPGRL